MSSTVGIISDTHGLIRPEALRALEGVDHIIHAGDIGGPDVLEALAVLAPVTAVRGNNDKGGWAESLPSCEILEHESAFLYVVHEIAALDLDPATAEIHAVVSGHSHKPSCEVRNGVLYLNPGSAGRRRFKLPVAVARIRVVGQVLEPEIVELHI